ncbi:unnamed protein product [Arabidopsis halleri]
MKADIKRKPSAKKFIMISFDALRVIGKTLKKTSWDFGFDPCDMASTGGRWRNSDAVKGSEDSITCDGSYHVPCYEHVSTAFSWLESYLFLLIW